MKNKNYEGKITVKGFDSSDSAIRTSKFLLAYENNKQWNNSIILDIKKVKDSLEEDWGENDIILMNPPFISWELLKEKESRDNGEAIFSTTSYQGIQYNHQFPLHSIGQVTVQELPEQRGF